MCPSSERLELTTPHTSCHNPRCIDPSTALLKTYCFPHLLHVVKHPLLKRDACERVFVALGHGALPMVDYPQLDYLSRIVQARLRDYSPGGLRSGGVEGGVN